jgi:integrase
MAELLLERGIFQKDDDPRCWIRYKDGSDLYRRELGGSFSQARKLLAKRRAEALQRKKLPETLRRRSVPFAEACDDTEAYIRKKYSKPQHDVGRLDVIRKWFRGRSLDSITPLEIEGALDGAQEANDWSASSWNHHHTLLSLTFQRAIRSGKAERNPARGIKRKSESSSQIVRYLTSDEERKLRETIRSNPLWAEHEPELDLALATGLRRSSMYEELMWENIDLVGKVATITRTKNGERVHIPLNNDAIKALMVFRSRGDGTGLVVRRPSGAPLKYNNFWFVPAVRAAGIKHFRWHDNRHTFASRLRQRGIPLGNIAELLGHKGLAMTQRYAHLAISNLHDAVARLESNSTQIAPGAATQEAPLEWVQ